MSSIPIVIRGIIRQDGMLQLENVPRLPAGPVEVTIRPLSEVQPAGEDWWQYLQQSRSRLEAAGHPFRTKEEIDADLEEMRSGDERLEEVHHQIEEARREQQEPPAC